MACMYIDITNKDLKKLTVGDKVSVRVTGTVKSISAGEPPEGEYEGRPPEIRLEPDKVSIEGSNVFADMAEED